MAAEGVKNDPRPSEAPSVLSTERVTSYGPIPASWLDKLLTAYCQVRADAPIEDSIALIVGTARDLLEDVAIGVSVPQSALPKTSRPPREGTRSQPYLPSLPSPAPLQLVVRVAAPTTIPPPADVDPTRLTPDLPFQRVFPFLRDGSGSLEAASMDDRSLADGSAGSLLLERVAMILSALVENQTAAERGLGELRAQVIQSEKLASLGQIAAGIVHELNNPLTTIVAYSDFLRRKLATRGDAADVERLSRINEAADRILRFSRDLTAYSRPSNEVPAPVSIHDVIERALSFCEHEIEKTSVSVERAFTDVRAVRGVAGQLTQVFVNLFTNAAHAMREGGGLLTITTMMREGPLVGGDPQTPARGPLVGGDPQTPARGPEGQDGFVVITITDDGHGIEEQHRPRVFDPFFTTKSDGSGTGLGLSIVRGIVQSHGGHISVHARVPRGTIFQVELPAAARPVDD